MNIQHCILPPQYNSDKIHPRTLDNIKKWVKINNDIDFDQKIWTNEECRVFLYEKFDKEVLKYFDDQLDGRFKSDLWRICVLYEYGGIYVDIDQEPLLKLSDFIKFNDIDFCGCTNMERYNLSNGFIYAKSKSNIILKNIEETLKRYRKIVNNDVNYIGGCYIMGDVISDIQNDKIMPLGEKKIGNENCLFLHEIGDISLKKISNQSFWDSFGVYDIKTNNKIMNSRYKNYNIDRLNTKEFIKI